MRISATIFVILISTCIVNASVLDPVIENVVHLKATKPPGEVGGIWKKKTIWKPRWVKEWKSAKVMKPVWRKVWSPIQIREWLPIPKPPPGWDTVSTPLSLVHPKPQKAPVKDSLGHDSFPAHSATTLPLWDPVPYPESQQPPPPPPFPRPLQNTDCGKGGCDNSPAYTFNHQQILEILGPRFPQPTDYYQNPEYSETVNHQTRLPPEGSNWRPPQPLPDIQFDNRFNSFRALPEFLIPPKSQPENIRLHAPNSNPPPLQNIPPWIPLPPENKIKGHFVTKTPEQPYKFELPERPKANNQTKPNPDDFKVKQNSQQQNISSVFRPHGDGDFIQEAQLVGEYHYSEFDLNVKQEPNKQQESSQQAQQQPRVKAAEQQRPTVSQQPVANKNKPQPAQKEIKQQPQQRPAANQHPVANSRHKPVQKDVKQPQLQRHAANPHPAADNKPKPAQKDVKQLEIHSHQSNSHIQKKHIPTPPAKSTASFQQQEALIKEIFPIFKSLQTNLNQTHPSNHRFESPTNDKHKDHSSTRLLPVNTQSNLTNFQQPKQVYPVYEKPQGVNANSVPPNHRFSFSSEAKQQGDPAQNATKLIPAPPPPKPVFDKANTVQLVFATAPDEQNQSGEDVRKSTTTERYEVIFSSSLLATTESATKNPLIIVTPVSPTSELHSP